ncbi:MAG TPA: protein kinase [Gemmatimonadales bacterium]|nr:protein kinase [Gemmatimonadales bacterium]
MTPPTELRDRLQAALGEAYAIEKELGGGGMSRVFLATEVGLGRKVVVKVLPPEMAAGVNIERFRREIQLAASLQHPHIVPLHAAGQVGDLFYYTMPLVEGESLRAKLAREGELPVGEAVHIMKDVADALAYAHSRGVVHRDIKPDNVLISGHHAVVTDFGVAKAVSAASGESSLTSLGVALGTPAYMAPEQAVADPHVDQRADIYALGVVGYEMLTGRLPFAGMSPQAMLAAHVTQAPDPVTAHRAAVPPVLSNLIMRCLEKKPADRIQRADELLGQIAVMATPSGGMTPTGATPIAISSGTEAAIRLSHPLRVAAMFAGGGLVVLGLVYLIMVKVGLPGWVFGAAVVLLLIGLPVILFTGRQERQRAVARTTGLAPVHTPTGLPGLFTWRKSILGGAVAFGVLTLGTGTYMGLRAFGVGPFGTLVSKGALKAQQSVILAQFVNRSTDTTLGPTLTEAFRVDLAQSPVVRLVDQQALGDALRRMQRNPSITITPDVAREIAQREGVTAIVTGQIDPVDKGFVLSASVLSAADGQVLTAVRASAADGGHLIEALDALSKQLRERIGESFKSIRAAPPLAQVTTGSLDALRKYSQALRLFEEGDQEGTIPLLQEATTLDTGFAMAWRKLAVVLINTSGSYEQATAAATKALRHGDRLSDLERNLTAAYYYSYVEWDPARVAAAYRSVLAIDPNNDVALNNLGSELVRTGEYAAAESLFLRGIALGHGGPFYQNAVDVMYRQGRVADAGAILERWAHDRPRDPLVSDSRANLAAAGHDYATAEREWRALGSAQRQSVAWQEGIHSTLAQTALAQGRLSAAEAEIHEAITNAEARGLPAHSIVFTVLQGWIDLRYRNRPAAALKTVDSALARHPLASMSPLDRPYETLTGFYAAAGRVDEARRLTAEFQRDVPKTQQGGWFGMSNAAAEVARAEGRFGEAITHYAENRDQTGCPVCNLYEIGLMYDRLGKPDSALASYERMVTQPGLYRVGNDALSLGFTYHRLGELYEAKGDRAKARDYYGRFVDLWKDADAELQPQVRDTRQRLARLAAER